MDILILGSAPALEGCVQVSRSEDYLPAMRTEARRYQKALNTYYERQRGHRLDDRGAKLFIKTCPHDFGPYLEVVVVFDSDCDESVEAAYWLEGNLPQTWMACES